MNGELASLPAERLVAGQFIALFNELFDGETIANMSSHGRDKHELEHQMPRWILVLGPTSTNNMGRLESLKIIIQFMNSIGFITVNCSSGGGFQVLTFIVAKCVMNGYIDCIKWLMLESKLQLKSTVEELFENVDNALWWDSALARTFHSWQANLILGRHPSSVSLLQFLHQDCKLNKGQINRLYQNYTQRRDKRTFIHPKRTKPPNNNATNKNSATTINQLEHQFVKKCSINV